MDIQLFNRTAHPLFYPIARYSDTSTALGEYSTPSSLLQYFGSDTAPPFQTDEHIKKEIRTCLRHHGFTPTGRGKPASEYLQKAQEKGWITPSKSINLAVDLCNITSMHSGLPISVIDLDLVQGNLSFRVCPPQTTYIFNPSGQIIKTDGLLALYDEQGPTAGPVKDAQRTKTHAETTRILTVFWGTKSLSEYTEEVAEWYTVQMLKEDISMYTIPIQKDE